MDRAGPPQALAPELWEYQGKLDWELATGWVPARKEFLEQLVATPRMPSEKNTKYVEFAT